MKKIITQKVESIDVEGSVEDLIHELQRIVIDNTNYYDLEVIKDFAYEGCVFYEVHGKRLETDAEEVKRMEDEVSIAKTVKEHELRMLKQLKEKYENKS